MADAMKHLDRTGILNLIMDTWAALVGLSPSEREWRVPDIRSVLDRSAERVADQLESNEALINRCLEVVAYLTTAGMGSLGSVNIYPDTPETLIKSVFEDAALRAIRSLEELPADSRISVLEALLPLGQRYLAQAHYSHDEIEDDLRALFERAVRTWRWGFDEGGTIFPTTLAVAARLTAGMIKRSKPTLLTCSEVERALESIHETVDKRVDRVIQEVPGDIDSPENDKARRKVLDRLGRVSKECESHVLSPAEVPRGRNEISLLFEDLWDSSSE